MPERKPTKRDGSRPPRTRDGNRKSERGRPSDAPRSGRGPSGAGRSSSAPSGGSRSGRGTSGPGRSSSAPREDRPPRDTSNDLPWPEEIFELELDPDLQSELEAAGGPTSTLAKHLLSVQVLAETDPETAYQHAARVRDRLPRAALARQTACIAAYRAGHFRQAIKEEAAYRRISGKPDLVPMAADSERGLDRPERALALLAEFDSAALEADTRTELLIVGAGARQDLGDSDAARVLAQKAVRAANSPMAASRARYALGRLLADAGDGAAARKWLESAADLDPEGVWTDAAEVLETL